RRSSDLSIPVLLVASVLVFVFVYNTSDPLARFRQNRDQSVLTTEGLRIGVLEKPCHQVSQTEGGNAILQCHKTPVLKQYWHWLTKSARGNRGQSFFTGHDWSDDFTRPFSNTFQLIAGGVGVAFLSAVIIRF